MKEIIKDAINEIKEDRDTIKSGIIYEYKKHRIEVVFVGKSKFNNYFKKEQLTHQYLFDHKSKNHMLFILEESFNAFKELYSDIVIVATLRLFLQRIKTNRLVKLLSYTTAFVLLAFNIILLFANEFKEIFYIPIISALIIFLVFFFGSKLMDELYLKEKERTQIMLESKFLKLKDEQIKDVYKGSKTKWFSFYVSF